MRRHAVMERSVSAGAFAPCYKRTTAGYRGCVVSAAQVPPHAIYARLRGPALKLAKYGDIVLGTPVAFHELHSRQDRGDNDELKLRYRIPPNWSFLTELAWQ